jgi:hypothetical protein
VTDRFPARMRTLEQELDLLRPAVALPPTPDIAEAVIEHLRGTAVAARPRRPWLAFGLAVVALLVFAAAAAAIAWAIGGVRLTFTEATPSPAPSVVAPGRVPGAAVSLAEARSAVDFPILLPELDGLGPPDAVRLDRRRPSGGSVALIYGARPGYPADAAGGGLVITEFRADIGPEVFEKLVHSGVRVDETSVAGGPAYWVSGGAHFFFYRDASGRMVDETMRLVGDTLIWESMGLTLRVEGAQSLEVARRIAASLR